MNAKSAEFTFIPPGAEGEAATYSLVVNHGLTAVFIRIGSSMQPFGVMVPRLDEDRYTGIDAESFARHAIGLALRDDLFNKHPNEPVYLDADVPQWSGSLTPDVSSQSIETAKSVHAVEMAALPTEK